MKPSLVTLQLIDQLQSPIHNQRKYREQVKFEQLRRKQFKAYFPALTKLGINDLHQMSNEALYNQHRQSRKKLPVLRTERQSPRASFDSPRLLRNDLSTESLRGAKRVKLVLPMIKGRRYQQLTKNDSFESISAELMNDRGFKIKL